jgi:hypothetical protein
MYGLHTSDEPVGLFFLMRAMVFVLNLSVETKELLSLRMVKKK